MSKISPEILCSVKTQSKGDRIDCIIYAKSFKNLCSIAMREKIDFVPFPFISAIGAKLSQNQIVATAKNTAITFITKQAKVFAEVNVARKIAGIDLNSRFNGENITLAVLDTGINPHLDFCLGENRIIKFVDLVSNKEDPYDDNGHGTFVAGVACGSGLVSGKKFRGVSPKSKIVAIKALDKNGEAGAYKILEGMQWIADNHKKYNIKVVCMSFGSQVLEKGDPLVKGAEVLWSLGIVVVAAAGNGGPEKATIRSPGYAPRIITVGALDDKRKENGEYSEEDFCVASFSSRGPAGSFYKPDLLSSGVNITGASFDEIAGSFYTKMSGTSVSAPIVAGVACNILSAYPYLTPDVLKVRLLGQTKTIFGDFNSEGRGFLSLKDIFK